MNQIFVNIFKKSNSHVLPVGRRYLSKNCPPYEPKKRKQRKHVCVTVLGAKSYMGRLLSLMLKQCPLINELRLYCPKENAVGIGLELAQIDTNTNVSAYFGPALLLESMRDADILAICSDIPHPSICEAKYLESEGYVIKNYATFAAEVNPNALFCIGCQPINSLVPLVSEEYKRANAYDQRKIMGISMNACSRASSIVACNLNMNPCEVRVPILGGLTKDTIVPVLSQTKPKIDIPPVLLDALYKKIIGSEEEIVEEKCNGETAGCDTLYAFACSRFITSLAKAIRGDSNVHECAFIKQTGEMAEILPYMSSLVRLSRDGVVDSYVPKLNAREQHRLEMAAGKLLESVHLGQAFITGQIPKKPRIPYRPPSCEPVDVKCNVLKAKIPEPSQDASCKIHTSEPKDPSLSRSEKPIKLDLDGKEKRKKDKRKMTEKCE